MLALSRGFSRPNPLRPPESVGTIPDASRDRLNRVRHWARDCRVWAANRAQVDPLARLVQALPRALGRAPRLFRPGVAEMSFDEAWLLAVFDALERGDGDSYRFLLQTRMSRAEASALHFLLCPARAVLDAAA